MKGVITISRQIGAGETSIAPAVAERLGWECVDTKQLDAAVGATGIQMPDVTHFDEHAPGLLEAWRHPGDAARYHEALARVIRERAEEGGVVIVGRGGNFLLKDTDALHVRLVAPMSFRIQRVMEVRWINEGPAREVIRQSDHDRAAYFRHFHKADWADPLHYHLVVNTGQMGIEGAVNTLLAAAMQRWPQALGR